MSRLPTLPKALERSSVSLTAKLTDKEKRKLGRPFVGEKPKNKRLEITIDEDTKAKLEAEKKRTGKSISQLITDYAKKL